MELLLRNNFTAHYGLPTSVIANISNQTTATYFELRDDKTLIYPNAGQGIAKYSNPTGFTITVIDYERFLNSLPPVFLQNREKCDLVVFTNQNQYFLLNELTDTLPKYVNPYTNNMGFQIGKRTKAHSQLLKTLTDLISVPAISIFIDSYKIKNCCFFNKQSNAPTPIAATTAFNRINTISTSGFKISNSAIELFGFELFEYSGNQIYIM